ncbi:BAK_1a_G0055200.mRNA.1.CDS.1 [Saccharomyces cerevisiae]|nr:BAK_1a_G0055200.mRNA.1.CDS.1 [Saccharomyces cerevisiae]CAI7385185.1 BAK_1a_G0055200.mRNA.1.CDS.1 [Saccharomyces cerevisiae]
MQSTVPIAIASNGNKRDVVQNVSAGDEGDILQRLARNREMISTSLSPQKSSGFSGRRRSSSVRDALSSFFGTGNSPTSSMDDYSNLMNRNYSTASTAMCRGNSFPSDVGTKAYNITGSYQPDRHRNSVPYTTIDQLHTRQDTGLRRESDPVAAKKISSNNDIVRSFITHHASNSTMFINRVLSDYLADRGFIKQTPLYNKKSVLEISIATSAESVFLPTTKSDETEYLSLIHGSLNQARTQPVGSTNTAESDFLPSCPTMDTLNENNDLSLFPLHTQRTSPSNTARTGNAMDTSNSDRASPASNNNTTDADSFVASGNNNPMNNNNSPARNRHPNSHSRSLPNAWNSQMPSFSFALIFSLNKSTTLSDIKVELTSNVRVVWFNGLPPTKNVNEECYNIGSLDWTLNADNFNLFIPQGAKSPLDIVENHSNNRKLKVLQKLSMRKRRSFSNKAVLRENILNNLNASNSTNKLNAGVYVFTIPIVLASRIPESLYYPSARVSYSLRLATKLKDEHTQLVASRPRSSSIPSPQKLRSYSCSDSYEYSQIDDTIEGETYNNDKNSTGKITFPSSWLKSAKGRLKRNNSNGSSDNNGASSSGLAMQHDSEDTINLQYPLHLVRTPPEISVTTANKPLYINKVWENCLSYEISFAQKYVPLDGEIPITIKVAPLVKSLSVKRIRVSCREKISYRSKDYQYDFDQLDPLASDPCNPYHMRYLVRKKKDRSLPLFEVASKCTSGPSIREEVVTNTVDDNLLAYTSSKENNKDIPFSESFTVKTKLKFPKYCEVDATKAASLPPYGIDLFDPIKDPTQSENTSNNGNVLGFLVGRPNRASKTVHKIPQDKNHNEVNDTNGNSNTSLQTSSNVPIQHYTRLNKPRRGLYLDSMHFKNIQCSHKLEIVLRVSKTDSGSSKIIRHYEVIVDTPIYLISDLCNTSNIDLPTYDMATTESSKVLPPTFEEATSVSASPRSSVSYYPDDISMQQLNLSRSTSLANGYLSTLHPKTTAVSDSSNGAPIRDQQEQQARPLRTEDYALQMGNENNAYSNMDGLLSQDIFEQETAATLFKRDIVTMNFNNNIFTPRYSPRTFTNTDYNYNDNDNNDNDTEGPGPIIHPGPEPPRYDEISS